MIQEFKKKILFNVGDFDNFFNTFPKSQLTRYDSKPQDYPQYNILKKDESKYSIEIAVVGYTKSDIEIISEGKKLSVIGNISKPNEDEFIHRGLLIRDFIHEFILAETINVKSADIIDGLLIIKLENKIAKGKKPRKISIGNHLETHSKNKENLHHKVVNW